MAAAKGISLNVLSTAFHRQKVLNRIKLEGEYFDLNQEEFKKVGDIYNFHLVIERLKTFNFMYPILIIEAKFIPRYLCMAGNGFGKIIMDPKNWTH
jgi:hypothetical protein